MTDVRLPRGFIRNRSWFYLPRAFSVQKMNLKADLLGLWGAMGDARPVVPGTVDMGRFVQFQFNPGWHGRATAI